MPDSAIEEFTGPSPKYMNARQHLLTLVGASTLFCAAPAFAVLGLFDKDEPEVPSADVLAKQEIDAQGELARAQQAAADGKEGKARDIYEDIVKDFSMTKAAAISQFQIGVLREKAGEEEKAFEAYQEFIDNYKGSDQFAAAIKSQYDIAVRSMNTKVTKVLGFIPAKQQPSKLIEMFEQIAQNAPYSEFAPKSLYQIGILHTDAGREDDAIFAFEELMAAYPKDPMATEAHYQIVHVRNDNLGKSEGDLIRTRDEAELLIGRNEDDPRTDDIRALVGKLEEKEAEKKFNVGRYYEKKGDLRAAAIYYMEVQQHNQRYEDAQARLDALRQQDPNVTKSPREAKSKVLAPTNVLEDPNFYGPPPLTKKELKSNPRPKMRTGNDDLQPIPVPNE